jgi:uncharacterized phage protein (TIGR02218 family)
MRNLHQGLAAHLAGETTTLCRCWRLIRRDGVTMGFTDHDEDVSFGATTFAARTGLEAAEATAELGFAVGGGEVAGAFMSSGITEADIEAGRYDDASVECWVVNWADPQERLLLDLHSIGEIKRADGAFVVELRGLMHRLDQERGRLYRAACSADLGDAACGVAVSPVSVGVEATDGRLTLTAPALAGYAADWFTGGKLSFTSGANAAFEVEIRSHASGGRLELWQRTPQPIATGDAFLVRPGCDKSFATCRNKFANGINFRGFPHMPGNDFIIRTPRQGEPGLDGGSLFR